MRGNPVKKDQPKKAYGVAQYADVMSLQEFAEHIASHGCVYSRADIAAVLTLAVDCMREQLMAGKKVQMGDLGCFSLSLRGKGAEKAQDYNPVLFVNRLLVRFEPGVRFRNLLPEADFNLVASRKAARAVVKALKAGETRVDLTDPKKTEPGSSQTEPGKEPDPEEHKEPTPEPGKEPGKEQGGEGTLG